MASSSSNKAYATDSVLLNGVEYQRGDELPQGEPKDTIEDLKDRGLASTTKPKDDDES